ncbi:hypothetical protein GCK72_026214 [Caenorhabditis remanei]|uniref:Uncharacterized protein n=1 Tax=Caenorhabditis remanei TaxID=31234 RepID=A0A6A5G4V1_CAERE|nr:hypothetical protein GCK72_026214 [Caenorhabditis remanei]KAF1749745.1 hypothetical protein GCK72_026214 [Caenorhabditis remanei]
MLPKTHYLGDCSPQDLARQFYAILAYGPPDERKMKTVEVLEHTVKSPIYEDWINVQAMNIYDSGKAFILQMVH